MLFPQYLFPVLVVKLLNALLGKEPWALELLQQHAKQVFSVDVAQYQMSFEILESGFIKSLTDHSSSDVHIEVKSDQWHQLFSDTTTQRMKAVRLQGDASLVHTLGELFKHLRWDIEADLASVIGDLPARWLQTRLKSAYQQGRHRIDSLRDNILDYLVYEDKQLLGMTQFNILTQDIRIVRDDVERLQKRVQRLTSLGRTGKDSS